MGMSKPSSRRLTVIVSSDIVGYSKLMAEDESGTLALLRDHRSQIFDPEVKNRGGRIVKLMGDGILVQFASVTNAVESSIAIQERMSADGALKLRIGINIGDVIEENSDIFGDGVNVAARLEALAPEGGICISELVHGCLNADLAAKFSDAGAHHFKNIGRPIGVYSWPSAAALTPQEEGDFPKRSATVAVLPIQDLTVDPHLKHIAAGLNEDLIAMLSTLDEIRLVSAPQLPDGVIPAQVGRQLGVDWILRGSVRAAGKKIRSNIQLIDCSSDRTVWAHRFDGSLAKVFDYQDSVVEEIVATLQVTIADGEQATVWRAEAGSLQAYRLFMDARASYKEYRRRGIYRAREQYEKALEINARFPAALVGLARTYIEDVNWGWSANSGESSDKARKLLEKAFEIRPDHALACSEMAHLLMVEKKFEEGLEWALKATRLAPTLGDAYHVCATLFSCMGRFEDTLHYSREAIRRTPLAPDFYFVVMIEAYIGLGKWKEAAALARRVLSRRPDWLMIRAALVISLVGLDQKPMAKREVEIIGNRSPHFSAAKWRRMTYNPDGRDKESLEQMLIEAGLPS